MNLSLTPRVAASGDITLELAAEFSLLGDDRNVGSEDNPINVPTFFTRNVTGVLRLRDGETGLIGGPAPGPRGELVRRRARDEQHPHPREAVRRARRRPATNSEVLISITPRVVRAPKVTESDLVALRVGTQEVPEGGGRAAAASSARSPSRRRAARGAPARRGAPDRGSATGSAPPVPAATGSARDGSARRRPLAVGPRPVASPEARRARSGGGRRQPPPAAPAPARRRPRPVTVLFSPPEVALRVGQAGGLALVLVGARDVQSIEVTLTWDPALAEVTDVGGGLAADARRQRRSPPSGRSRTAGRACASRGRWAPPARARWWR